jgi:cell division protease FtsH
MRKEPVFIVVIALFLLFIVQQSLVSKTPEIPTVPYSQFLDAVQEGLVLKADVPRELDNGGAVTARLKDGRDWQTIAPRDASMLGELKQNNVQVLAHNPEHGNFLVNLLLNLLPTIIIVGLLLYMTNKSSGGNLFSMKKNPAKRNGEKSEYRFSDVAGIDESKAQVAELVSFLKTPEKYAKLGGRTPRGVLLVGGPGNGKTLLAKAIAGEAGVPFFSASGSDFVEMFVGVGAARVRELFSDARKAAPCIIFIDEIDAVGRQRSSQGHGGSQESEQTLNQILVEMDGFETGNGIIVLASTNRPDILDKALLRAGRFDRHVDVPAPDVKGREQILKVHVSKMPIGPDVRLDVLARGTPGFSGAELANLANEAALQAAAHDRRLVEMIDFESAKDVIMMGAERKTMVMSEKERRTTAYHEAGHAAVGLVLGEDPVHKVSIIPRGRALGVTMHLPQEDRYCLSKEHFEAQLVMLLGGRAAEAEFVGIITTGASNDMERATTIAHRMVTEWGMSDTLGPLHYGNFGGRSDSLFGPEVQKKIDDEVMLKVNAAYAKAQEVMVTYRSSIEKMTQLLLRKETIDRREVEGCFPEHIQARARELWDRQPDSKNVIAPEMPRSSLPELKKQEGGGTGPAATALSF